MSDTDADLLERFVNEGDRDALDRLARRYIDFVYATACRELPADTADDVTQAVFLILARKAASVPRRRIGGWLFRTTRYCCAADRRSAARRSRHERNAAVERSETSVMANPISAAESIAIIPLLNDVLATLRRADREAIVLRYLRGEEVSAIATSLGTNEPAARKRITRALNKLRQAFARRGVTSATLPALTAAFALASSKSAPAATVAATSAAVLSPAAATPAASAISIGAMKMMLIPKIKFASAAMLAVALVVGAGVAVNQFASASTPSAAPSAPPNASVPATPLETFAKRLRDAGTIQVESHATTVQGGQPVTVDGSLQVVMPDRLRAALQINASGDANAMVVIINGDQRASWMNGRRQEQRGQAVQAVVWLDVMSRVGIAGSILQARRVPAGEEPPPPDIEKDFPISDLKETTAPIDGVPRPAIAYSIGGPYFPEEPVRITLWLDPATGLPVRREMASKESTITETYANWKLGEPLAAAVFDTQNPPAK